MAEAKVDISIEVVVHKALAQCLQSIRRDTGIMINSINVGWMSLDTINERDAVITNLSMTTSRPIAPEEQKDD